MKWFFVICLGLGWLLVGCAGETPSPVDVTPTKPPIKILPGGSSILVPPTLSPAEMTALPERALVELVMMNQSDWDVCYVYISPPSQDTWGDDWLGSEEVIKYNQNRVFKIPPGLYDVRAENCDYIGLNEQYEIDISNATSWEVTNPAVLDIDSFEEKGDWKISGSTVQGIISDEAYILIANQQGGLAFATAGKKFDNLVLTLEATLLKRDGYTPAGYGVMCRVQANGDGYLFMIREDGQYAIFRYELNKRVPLVNWMASSDVLPPSQLNVIEAHCDGENLALRINGVTVGEIVDSTYKNGDIGLAVLPGESKDVKVQFDNLVVTGP